MRFPTFLSNLLYFFPIRDGVVLHDATSPISSRFDINQNKARREGPPSRTLPPSFDLQKSSNSLSDEMTFTD